MLSDNILFITILGLTLKRKFIKCDKYKSVEINFIANYLQMSHAMVSSKTKWESFFVDAGIPYRQATVYATTFSNNRMRLDMLDELNKDILRDLGVKALGDLITILRYSKHKHFVIDRSPAPILPSSSILQLSDIKSSSTEKIKSTISLPTRLKSSFSNIKCQNESTSSQIKNTTPQNVSNAKNEWIHHSKNNQTTKRISVISNPTKISLESMNNSKATEKTSESINSKAIRLKLSERFDGLETEAKRIKVEVKDKPTVNVKHIKFEKKEQVRSDANLNVTPIDEPIQFTVQVPSKQPINASDVAKLKPKITVVPAQGKALTRSKYLTSIFERLDAPSSSSVAVGLLSNNDLSIQKNNVFKRLGCKATDNFDGSSHSFLNEKYGYENVFHRLGDHQLEDM